MIAKFIRSGPRRQTLHVAGCPRVAWGIRFLSGARRWTWADDQPAWRILAVVHQFHMQPCGICKPMTRIEGGA